MAVWRGQRVADFGLALMSRRFPPPWSVEETDACFIVRDHNGQPLAYVYFELGAALGGAPPHPRRGPSGHPTHSILICRSGRRLFRVSYVAQISHG